MRLLCMVLLGLWLSVSFAAHADAQEVTPTPVPPSTVAESGEGEAADDFLNGSSTGATGTSAALGTISAVATIEEEASTGDDGEVAGTVDPTQGAGRASAVVSPLDEPCAEWSDGSSVSADSSDSVSPLGADEQAAQDAAYKADRLETEGIAGEDLAAFIADNRSGSSRLLDGKAHKAPAARHLQTRIAQIVVAQSDYVPDRVATTALLNQIKAAESASTPGVPVDGAAPECAVPYVCAAERVDDVISGHIDSEPDGAYAEYVGLVATWLTGITAGVRTVEADAPGLGVSASIPVPSSEEGVQSLTGVLAERGLGDAPGELFLPELNYCRRGAGGEIEIDSSADPRVQPQFTWTALDDEFDIPGASAGVFDRVSRELRANLPEMRTIPPIESGVTIVQFPMWLWLNEPFTHAEKQALSRGTYIRVRGRATFDHVTWTLGDHQINCTLEEMQAYVPDTGMNPADKPTCHHIFTQLVDYTITAAVTYRIEQQVSIRRSLSAAFPERAWEPHPISEFVTIENVSPQLRVEAIYSVNVPMQSRSEQLTAAGDQ